MVVRHVSVGPDERSPCSWLDPTGPSQLVHASLGRLMTSLPFSLPVSVVALLLGFSLYSSCPPPVFLLLSRHSVDVLFLLSHTNQAKRETKQGYLIKPNAMLDTAKRKRVPVTQKGVILLAK